MRDYIAEKLLTWPGQRGRFPPAPNPEWKTPTRSTFTIDWLRKMNTDWNKQLGGVFAHLFLKDHKEYRGRSEADHSRIIPWFNGHCAYLKREQAKGLVARSPEEVRAKKIANAIKARQRQVTFLQPT